MAIEIHLDGKPVTRLQAAQALAPVGTRRVVIGELDDDGQVGRGSVSVRARHQAYGLTFLPEVSWPSGAEASCGARTFMAMIALGAEVAELAEMIAAEQDAPGSAPRCTWCHEPAVDGEYCAPCAAAKAKVNTPEQGAPMRVLTATAPEHPQEGWSRIIPPQKKSHYFVNGRSLCGRYGLPPEPLNPDDYTSPDDCAGCRKKLTLRQLDRAALAKGPGAPATAAKDA